MMAELSDIVNETVRGEIEEFLEDPAEVADPGAPRKTVDYS